MSYHIVYRTNKKKTMKRNSMLRLPLLIVLFFGIFLIGVGFLWPDGADFIQRVIFSDHKTIAVSALNHLADDLLCGEGLKVAFTDFYRNLLS